MLRCRGGLGHSGLVAARDGFRRAGDALATVAAATAAAPAPTSAFASLFTLCCGRSVGRQFRTGYAVRRGHDGGSLLSFLARGLRCPRFARLALLARLARLPGLTRLACFARLPRLATFACLARRTVLRPGIVASIAAFLARLSVGARALATRQRVASLAARVATLATAFATTLVPALTAAFVAAFVAAITSGCSRAAATRLASELGRCAS